MGKMCINHLKLVCQQSGVTDKLIINKLSRLLCRSTCNFSSFHHSNIFSNNNIANSANYSTNYDYYKKYKPDKVASTPESEAAEPIFQYATDKSKPSQRVYMWGHAAVGALGNKYYITGYKNKSPLEKQRVPARLSFIDDYEITNIGCGYGFTVISAFAKRRKEYGVYGCGINTDSQIGYHLTTKNAPKQMVISPSRICMPFELPSTTRVQQISCGRAHTLILTNKEGVFSLGNNAYGQCGRAIIEKEKYRNNSRINKVDLDEEITQINCGQDNSLFLTKNGEVLTCGWGADGQLGNGSYNNEGKPKIIGGDIAGEKIKQVSCAADCVLAVSEKGDLFGWGNNEYGQVSLNSDIPQLSVPKHIPLKNCGKITEAAAGGTICAVLNTEGQVFVWGYGILGMGPSVQHLHTPTQIPMTLFGYNDFNTTIKVQKLLCSLSHFAAINSNGDLYMWGHNKYGCLGLGKDGDQFFPLKVN
ncbi:Williams-Beuren syndrome chromosome region 16 protein, variant 2 [Chamberlinius hualienensis]